MNNLIILCLCFIFSLSAQAAVITISVQGNGTINSTPIGIENCSVSSGICSFEFEEGKIDPTTAEFVASAPVTWQNCTVNPTDSKKCSVLLTEDKVINVTFQTGDCLSGKMLNNVCYPKLETLSFDKSGLDIKSTTLLFGGISAVSINSNGVESLSLPEKSLTIKKDQTISVNGLIIPQHQGSADIIAVGLYVPENSKRADGTVVTLPQTASKDYCDPVLGDFYMNTASVDFTDNYCNWIVDRNGVDTSNWCNTPDNRRSALGVDVMNFWNVWKGNLNTLRPMYSNVSLDSNGVSKLLYKDTVNYTGQVCLYFGYRLTDQTLVFNGEPIIFRVTQ